MLYKSILLSSLIVTCISFAGCASNANTHYEKLAPLTAQEQETMSCEDIQSDLKYAQDVLSVIGDVRVDEDAMAGLSVGMIALRASLGGVNSSDFTAISNRKEKIDASEKAQARLTQLEALHQEKDCISALGIVDEPSMIVEDADQASASEAVAAE